jgi:hypothetical protein
MLTDQFPHEKNTRNQLTALSVFNAESARFGGIQNQSVFQIREILNDSRKNSVTSKAYKKYNRQHREHEIWHKVHDLKIAIDPIP